MKNSNSISFLDALRGKKLSNSDLYNLLRNQTNQLDNLFVKLFQDDLDLYLIESKQNMIDQFSENEINNEIKKRKEAGLPIPMIMGMTNKKDFKITDRYNIEELMFPYEFRSHYNLKTLIEKDILPYYSESNTIKPKDYNDVLVNKEHVKKSLEDIENNTIVKHKFLGTKTEFIELIKSLMLNKNFEGIQKEIIKDLAIYFEIDIKNPDQLIQDIKNRNLGSETLFLDKLKSSLLDFIKK